MYKAGPPCGGPGEPVSRILSWDVIPLGRSSLIASSDLPAGSIGPILTSEEARQPIWSCSVGGLPSPPCCQERRWALTPPFHPYLIPVAGAIGGLLSVALSIGSPRPGITWPTALWSPDFPLRVSAATPWSTLIGYTKKPPIEWGALDFNVAATYFSTCVPGSIIGPLELNCRVRDGNGCDLQGKATTKGSDFEVLKRRVRRDEPKHKHCLIDWMQLIDEKSSQWTN